MPRAKGQLAKTGGRSTEELTIKQEAFALEYVANGFNAWRAAETVGYNPINGSRCLRIPKVRDYISSLLEEKVMTANEVLSRLSEQARSDYAEFIQSDGSVDLEGLLAANKGHLIKAIKKDRYGHRVIEFTNSQEALKILAKFWGLARNRLEVEVKAVSFSTIEIIHQVEPKPMIIEQE